MAKMNCKCGGNSKVVSTVKKDIYVFRQRKCVECGRKWYTEEKENNSVIVVSALSNRNKFENFRKENEYDR